MTTHCTISRLFFPTVLAVCLYAAPMAADMVWDQELGWIDLDRLATDTDQGLYTYGVALFVQKEYGAAADRFEALSRRFPDSPYAPRAAFRQARCEMARHRYEEAVRIVDDLVEREPADADKTAAVALQIEALKAFAQESPHRAAPTLNHIAAHAASSAQRYEILMAEGDARYAAEDYAFAAEAYGEAVSVAPEPLGHRTDALFLGARSDVAQCREARHDPERLGRALGRFQAVASLSPVDDPRLQQVAAYIHAITRVLAEPNPHARSVYYAMTCLPEGDYTRPYSVFRRESMRASLLGTEVRETAHFYRAECLFQRGKHWPAFSVFRDFLAAYPDTVFRYEAIRRQFEIGKIMMDAEKRSRAIEVFQAVIDADPTLPHASAAEMYTGLCYLADHKYRLARLSFESVYRDYPESEWSMAALFQSGVAGLRAARYAADDSSLLDDASGAFALYLGGRTEEDDLLPDRPFAAEARRLLAQCEEAQARSLLRIAQCYERIGQPIAAAMYYKRIVTEHPSSGPAATSQTVLGRYREQGVRVP